MLIDRLVFCERDTKELFIYEVIKALLTFNTSCCLTLSNYQLHLYLMSRVTYPEIWRSPNGDAASSAGNVASPLGDLQILGYVTLLISDKMFLPLFAFTLSFYKTCIQNNLVILLDQNPLLFVLFSKFVLCPWTIYCNHIPIIVSILECVV